MADLAQHGAALLCLALALLAAGLAIALLRLRRRSSARTAWLQQALLQERRLAAAAETARIGFVALDDALRVRWVRHPPPDLGLPAAQWQGKRADALFGAEPAAALLAAQQRVLAEGRPLSAEFMLDGPSGRRCIEWIIAPSTAAGDADSRAQVLGLHCALRDVTEARAAREHEARMALGQEARDALSTAAAAGSLSLASGASGASAASGAAAPPFEAALQCLPEAVELLAPVTSADGGVEDFRWIWLNAAAAARLGRPAAALAGQRVLRERPDDAYAAARARQWRAALASGTPQRADFAGSTAPGAGRRACQLLSYPLPGAGEPQLLVITRDARASDDPLDARAADDPRDARVADDAPDAAQPQARLAAAHAELQRAARLKDDFLATLSHELRTPLNAIAGWAHVLGRAELPDAAMLHRAADAIERNVRLQSALVNHLLDLSRIASGSLTIEQAPADVAGALASALDAVRPAAEAKWIVLDGPARTAAPALCMGDAARLAQIFELLLDNAVKYAPLNGRVQATLELSPERLTVAIRDNGAGIAPDALPRLFDRFAPGDRSIARRQGGVGIGLAIVRSLVDLHGGRVSAASDGPGQGACFTVELPRLAAAAPAAARNNGGGAVQARHAAKPLAHAGAPALAHDGEPPLAWRRILLLEDETDSLELLSLLLREQGAIVRAFDRPEPALAAAENSLFDLVISDLGVPGMDGLEFLRRLRARPFAPKAIALTAYSDDASRAAALDAGYSRVEHKPIVPPEFLRVVIAELGPPAAGGSAAAAAPAA